MTIQELSNLFQGRVPDELAHIVTEMKRLENRGLKAKIKSCLWASGSQHYYYVTADTTYDFPLDLDIYKGIKKIKAKPFSNDFDIQAEAATKLYGDQLKLSFTNADIENAFDEIKDYYSAKIIARAKKLLYNQKHKYGYMFN